MAKKDAVTSDNQDQEQIVTGSSSGLSTASTENASPPKNKPKAGGPPSGFYIYIGPSIAGLIRNGDIFRGDRAAALAKAQKAIEKYPLVKTLIIPGDSLPTARLKVKTPGNALHANYVKLTELVKADYAKKNKNK